MNPGSDAPFEIESLMLTPDPGGIPNHPAWPALIYRQARPASSPDLASWWQQSFHRHGWRGIWRWSVYDYPHFHPNAHEVLGVARGAAAIQVGGREAGRAVEVTAGDVLLLPAGTGHELLQSSRGFQVVGAYPPGQENYETWRPLSVLDDRLLQKLREVPAPRTDPVTGLAAPLLDFWK